MGAKTVGVTWLNDRRRTRVNAPLVHSKSIARRTWTGWESSPAVGASSSTTGGSAFGLLFRKGTCPEFLACREIKALNGPAIIDDELFTRKRGKPSERLVLGF